MVLLSEAPWYYKFDNITSWYYLLHRDDHDVNERTKRLWYIKVKAVVAFR